MASFEIAYNWMKAQEDAADLHATVPDRCPEGCTLDHCFAISGVNSGAWPDEYAAIAVQPQDQRGPLVEAFYQAHFWNQWYAQLTSDEVAKRVFDFAVNAGSTASVRCLQEACNSLVLPSMAIATDGEWGPVTIKQTTLCFERDLVSAFQQRRVAHYDALIDANPKLAIYKDAWTARALK